MIFNLVHRASDSDEYNFQRKCAHDLNLKATILVPTKNLSNKKITDIAKYDNDTYEDEIGIWLCPTKDMPKTMIWLLSEAEKEKAVKYSIDKYKEVFGRAPKTVGNYVMDSHLIKMVKDYCPEVEICVAGCFEEGVKVFHGCNNSWYLFSEGMSWNPWYPAKEHSLRPARNEEEWAGVVAVPHLSRDLVLGYESRNDFFASHPANVQRGLANEGMIHEYDFNLADQYRMQEDFNDGFSYYQIHVSPGWLHHNHNIIDSDEVTQKIYYETLKYMVRLREEGELIDMHMSEFAKYYKEKMPIGKANVALGKDILYGSGKHYFWINNPDYRVLIDAFQGGSIGDLRPYAGEYKSFTGTDSNSLDMNSYPYIIQSQYRSGVKNHYQDGSRTTVYVKHNTESLDMCMYPVRVKDIRREENEDISLLLTPAELEFGDGLKVKIQTCYRFVKDGKIEIIRKIIEKSEENAGIELTEYVKACWGFTEYPEKMKGIELYADGKKAADYTYSGKTFVSDGAAVVSAIISTLTTEISLSSVGLRPVKAEISDGTLFSPYYTMKLIYTVPNDAKEVKSCLTLKKTKA